MACTTVCALGSAIKKSLMKRNMCIFSQSILVVILVSTVHTVVYTQNKVSVVNRWGACVLGQL